MHTVTVATIGLPREDGDYDVVATLRNPGGISPRLFHALIRGTRDAIFAATGELPRVFHREDATDVITPDYDDQRILWDKTNGFVYMTHLQTECRELLKNATFQDGIGTILTQDAEALETALAAQAHEEGSQS